MKTKLLIYTGVLLFAFSLNANAQKKVRLKKTPKKIMKRYWSLDTEKYLDTNKVEVEDVFYIKNTYYFVKDTKKKDKLAYSKKTGDGLLAMTVLGWWKIEEKNTLILEEWDASEGKTLPPETYKIDVLTEDKLILIIEEGLIFPFYITE